MTLACEDANSKLVEVVNTVADVDAEKRVGNRFGSRGLAIKLLLLFRL